MPRRSGKLSSEQLAKHSMWCIKFPVLIEARAAYERGDVDLKVYQAFKTHFHSAKARNIPFNFTIHSWDAWWQTYDEEHGCIRWSRRGLGAEYLVMARFGDTGPYSQENVYCATHAQNARDVPSNVRASASRHGNLLRSIPVITSLGRFGSISSAARAHGLHVSAGWTHLQRGEWQRAPRFVSKMARAD